MEVASFTRFVTQPGGLAGECPECGAAARTVTFTADASASALHYASCDACGWWRHI